ncbi:DUF1592 domain-containing protein [Lentisphaera marina]|uniref:DUF1592 domain-containing protein n=1 Tax=Lentisphaera marina TaxID=1111041 RepID=UPI002366F0A2|nr:DUF1592 domain-containing protein [Lentisphaera marina]MDD7984766.1 DUF1592 domain-containing protein [Lentisphaera marina]
MKYVLCVLLSLLSLKAANDNNLKIDASVLRPFVESYCIKCHGEDKQKGDVRLDQLFIEGSNDVDLSSEHRVFDLNDILDQLHLGEMPPKKEEKQPKFEEIKEITDFLSKTLLDLEKNSKASGAVLRRLTIQEYKNTVRDLLGLDTNMLDYTKSFPADDEDHGFLNIGESQIMSESHLDSYLDAAKKYLDIAFQFGPKRQKTLVSLEPNDWGLEMKTNGDWVFKFNNQHKYIDIGSGQRDLDDKNSMATAPEKLMYQRHKLKSGYYKIRIKAEAANRLSHPYDVSMIPCDLTVPMQLGLYSADSQMGITPSGTNHRKLLKVYDLKDNETGDYELTVWLNSGQFPFVNWQNGPGVSDSWMRYVVAKYHDDITYSAKQGAHRYTISGKNTVPGRMVSESWQGPVIRIHGFEMEGPLDHLPTANDLYLGGKRTQIRLDEAINSFAEKAYRRPLEEGEMQAYIKMARDMVQFEGKTQRQALLLALQAVMVSRDFLYISEKSEPGKELNSYEIASRLSYAIWGSLPDEKLLNLAQADLLKDKEVRREASEWMLKDPKAEFFTNSFTNSWLHLSKLGEMPPDKRKFYNYYRDNLKEYMRDESRMFFDYILKNNKAISDFIDADYSFINKQLADLYGIEGVQQEELKKMALPANIGRGGLLGQASILTLTANGVDTSPIIRGVWVLENILGTPPAPPPPDVEPLEPDVRGAKTLKERLAKHRDVEACADCHSKIDPYGFPLELYDPIGEFRPRYNRNVWDTRKNKKWIRNGHKVDGSSELPGGEQLSDLASLKKVLMSRKDLFARNLTNKLLKHAVGRHLTRSDKDEVSKILEQEKASNYPFKDLLIDVISSDAFIRK